MLTDFKDKFKKERMDAGYTQQQTARLLDVSQSAVSAWERGDYIPLSDCLIKIARVFDVSTDYLLGLTDD